MFLLGEEKLAGFAGAEGQAGWVGLEAGDGVEGRVLGGDPEVGPRDEAGGEEGFGGEEVEGVVEGEAVCVQEDEGFEGREEDGEDFELVVGDFERGVLAEVVFDDETLCVQRGEDFFADVRFVLGA